MAVDETVPADGFDIEEAEDAPFNRAEFMNAMRAKVQQQLTAALPGVTLQAVDNSFDRLSTTMQKSEARQAKQDRRLHELSGQLSAVQDQLTKMNVCLEKVAQGGVGIPQHATSASPTPAPYGFHGSVFYPIGASDYTGGEVPHRHSPRPQR